MKTRIVLFIQTICLVGVLSLAMPCVGVWASGSSAETHANMTEGAPSTLQQQEEARMAENAGETHATSSVSPEKLKDLFWRAANFLVLVIVLAKLLGKPIINSLSSRRQQIKEELDDLLARRDDAEKTYKEFETRLAGMEQEMEGIVEKAIAQAQVEKERILADAERAAEEIRKQAEAAVQTQMEEAKRLLREEIAEQATAMAEELIIKNLTPADQVAITEQYLEKVGAVQ